MPEYAGLVVDASGSVRLHAGVGGSRDVPGEAPVKATRHAHNTRDSRFT